MLTGRGLRPRPLEGVDSAHSTDEIVIGLALGSPRQNPLPALPAEDHDYFENVFSTSSKVSIPASTRGTETGETNLKRKWSRWKAFGGLFGRNDVTLPFNQLDQSNRDPLPKQVVAPKSPEPHSTSGAPKRRNANSEKTEKVNGQAKSSQDVGRWGLLSRSGSLNRSSSRLKGRQKSKIQETLPDLPIPQMPGTIQPLRSHAINKDDALPQLGGPSLLQVEIPTVEMERYSVMFGDVLQPQVGPKLQSSPLVQRSRNLEELDLSAGVENEHSKLAGRESLREPIRSDTFALHNKSLSFSLCPAPASPSSSAGRSNHKSATRLSALSRPVTTTSVASRSSHRSSKSQDSNHLMVFFHPEHMPVTPAAPSPLGRNSSLPSPRSTNSTQASFFECSEYPSENQPPTSFESGKDTLMQRAFPARKSSMKAPRLLHSPVYIHEPNDSISSPVEISTARQISVSRRQRQLLVPIVQKVVRKPMQPTLVNSQSTPALRKSEHPVSESV